MCCCHGDKAVILNVVASVHISLFWLCLLSLCARLSAFFLQLRPHPCYRSADDWDCGGERLVPNRLYNLLLLAFPRKTLSFFFFFLCLTGCSKMPRYITPLLCNLANLRGDGCLEGKRGSFLPSHRTAAVHKNMRWLPFFAILTSTWALAVRS